MTPAQTRALLALADLSGPTQRTVVASQVAHALWGSARSRGRGPGGRPASAARLLDVLHGMGLAYLDYDRTTYQRQWWVSQAGLDLAASLTTTTERETQP